MNGRDLGLQNGVDEAVARKHVLALELRGDDHGLESLTTAAYTIIKYDQHSSSTDKDLGIQFLPDRSSISTCCACSTSSSLSFSESAVIPEVSAMAALTAEKERAEREKAAWGTGRRR